MKKQATLFRLCLLALATLLLGTAQANNVKITGTTVNDTLVTVNGSWQNGWCLSNHSNDAIYIFYKYRSNGAQQWEHGMQASPGTNTVVTFPNSIVTYTNGALNPVNGAVKLLNKIGGSVHWGNHNNYRGACLFVPPITADGVYDSCQFTFKIKPDLPNALSTYEFKFFAVEMVNIRREVSMRAMATPPTCARPAITNRT